MAIKMPEDFFILNRVGKNSEKYILEILDLSDNRSKCFFYDRSTEIFDFETEITPDNIKGFVDYENPDTPVKIPEPRFFDLRKYVLHRFEDSVPKLRTIQCTLKDRETGTLFAPCCGKHKDHDKLKIWGSYINTYVLDGYPGIEGYKILNGNLFDEWVLGINPETMIVDLTQTKDFLFRELRDYLEDQFLCTSDQIEIVVRHASGREIKVEI